MTENAPITSGAFGEFTVEGYSRAAVQSYWRVPEMKVGFDLGAQPWSFMGTPTWLVTHTHLDHIAALQVYVARRRMMKMEPPVIYLPEPAVDPVFRLLRMYSRLDRGRLPCELMPARPGDEIELSRELVITAHQMRHTVPALGYLVWERRKKLKAQYRDLSGTEIRDLKFQGVEITEERRFPRVAYTGDTAPAGLDENPDFYRADVLIMEMTFVARRHRPEKIHKLGHIHLDDVIARRDRFENHHILACHFSTRYHDDQVRRIVEKRLPDMLGGKLKLWL